MGLFAASAIAPGEVCLVMGGRVLPDRELSVVVASGRRYGAAAIHEGLNILQADDDPIRCGNRSCDPNLWLADEVSLVARRQIAGREEATVDFALMTVDPDWRMACQCRSAVCRSSITGNDWRLPALQDLYQRHFAPFIIARIGAEGTANQS